MSFLPLIATLLAIPLVTTEPAPVEIAQNVEIAQSVEMAQSSDAYANWIYLYDDAFENSAGQEVTQQWWLNPNTVRQNDSVEFTLLARRSPVSSNGTAAAVCDYIGNCSSMGYAIEQIQMLDSNDVTIDSQTTQRVMETADPDSKFYGVLQDLCSGAY